MENRYDIILLGDVVYFCDLYTVQVHHKGKKQFLSGRFSTSRPSGTRWDKHTAQPYLEPLILPLFWLFRYCGNNRLCRLCKDNKSVKIARSAPVEILEPRKLLGFMETQDKNLK